jgi:1-acyl-sn-glycerol-3-phosphate acyltransferase
MTVHSENSSIDLNKEGKPTESSIDAESSIREARTLRGRIHYWWSLSAAGALLLLLGTPAISIAWLCRKREMVYPWALFGGRAWLFLSGAKVKVVGLEKLDKSQTYVFISNHRSYLDTATLFAFLNRRIGILAKKELLKVPILGVGMGYVNVMAIDRSNRERALKTTGEATARIKSGISFGVFAEGTRAKPGEFLPFKKGAFYMAAQANVPIVPVAIKNTDELMGKGTGVAKSGLIEMVLLPPVSTDGISTDEDVNQLVKHVHSVVAKELGVAENSVQKTKASA